MQIFDYSPDAEYESSSQMTQICGINTTHVEIRNLGVGEVVASTIEEPFLGNDTTRVIAPYTTVTLAVNVYNCSVYIQGGSTVKFRGVNLADAVSEQRLSEETENLRSYAESLASMPNILSNPDFAVNQRGQQEYTEGYCADRWKLITANTKATVLADGVKIGFASDTPAAAVIGQAVEDYTALAGKEITASVFVGEKNAEKTMLSVNFSVNGKRVFMTKPLSEGRNEFTVTVPEDIEDFQFWIYGGDTRTGTDTSESCIVVNWAKIEISRTATGYIPPRYADNLLNCQRYYQIRTTGDIAAADLRPVMARTPDITQRPDGLYEYSADII